MDKLIELLRETLLDANTDLRRMQEKLDAVWSSLAALDGQVEVLGELVEEGKVVLKEKESD